jgi:hypothetical protein
MNFRQSVPDYLTNKRNTFIQVLFTAIFAFVFIIIYRPFGYENWYGNIGNLELYAGTVVVVVLGMVTIILTRIIMFLFNKNHEITLAVYIWMIILEVLLLGAFYTALEKVILKDDRPTSGLFLNAVQNTTLILLIPYILSGLFFAWSDIKKKFDQVVQQFRDPAEIFIPFKDENGILRLTLKSVNILYLESSDNYVVVNYLDNEKQKKYLVRNNLKNLEKNLKDYPIFRCHRSYSVNIRNVKMIRKVRSGYELVMAIGNEESIPVSKSYEKKILELMNVK